MFPCPLKIVKLHLKVKYYWAKQKRELCRKDGKNLTIGLNFEGIYSCSRWGACLKAQDALTCNNLHTLHKELNPRSELSLSSAYTTFAYGWFEKYFIPIPSGYTISFD